MFPRWRAKEPGRRMSLSREKGGHCFDMEKDALLRQQLVQLLKGGNAHTNFEDAIKDFPAELRGKRPKGSPHSPWELLEHMRIAQWDILEFSRDGKHQSPKWPEGYWPSKPE